MLNEFEYMIKVIQVSDFNKKNVLILLAIIAFLFISGYQFINNYINIDIQKNFTSFVISVPFKCIYFYIHNNNLSYNVEILGVIYNIIFYFYILKTTYNLISFFLKQFKKLNFKNKGVN